MWRILLSSCLLVCLHVGITNALCSNDNCPHGKFCVSTTCMDCDRSCDGCRGPGNDLCDSCSIGYKPVGIICQACSSTEFGVNCTGVCHCLHQNVCSPTDGFCEVWKCNRGWKDPPYCQEACGNGTFGLDCSSDCHCPNEESCNPVNGLCKDGICDSDYGGPSCQLRLPKLVNSPEVASVACRQANVTWLGWREEVDLGVGPISQYRLYRQLNNTGPWQIVTTTAESGREVYWHYMSDLEPDVDYRFRLDVYRQDGDKVQSSAALGFKSDLIFIPCTATTEAPPTTTTTRSIIGLKVFKSAELTLLANGNVRMTWEMTPNASSLPINFNFTLYYQEVSIGDCAVINGEITVVPLEESKTGSYDIQNLTPWRVYAVVLEASGDVENITDILERRISTTETAPTGTVSNIDTRDLTSRSAEVTWADVPCGGRGGVLVRYVVVLASTGATLTDSSNTTAFTFDNLLPFTNYTVAVRYENSEGVGPASSAFSFITEEEAPGPMMITGLTAQVTTILVTFSIPNPVNGLLTDYTITYADNPSFTTPKKLVVNASYTEVTIDSLRPYTRYYIKMQARTNAGYGPMTDTVTTTTNQDKPESPISLSVVFSNETCIHISWEPPEFANGPLQSYRIIYQQTSGEGDPVTVAVSENTTEYRRCDLQPGSLYLFSVAAKNGWGFSEAASRSFWTEQGTPRAPPVPVYINATYSTLLIEIEPVLPTTGPITKYQIHLEQTTAREKRDTPPGYVTAVLLPSDVQQRRFFEIGDGRLYGGAENKPLARETWYNVYYLVDSTLNGKTKTAFSQMKDPLYTAPPPPVTTAGTIVPGESGDNTGLIIGIIVGLIMLILLILLILLLLWWCKRRNTIPSYKPHLDSNSYDLLPVVKDDYVPEKYWNTTYSTRESRYIVAGREYLPEDQVTMNGDALTNTGAEPVTFKNEFKSLPHEFPKHSKAISNNPRNKHKNRFPHLLPYDKSRVVIQPDDNSTNDYINASFISGYKKPSAYIAAQSPFDEDTVLDFWRMISQKHIRTIVMITNIVEDNIVKCTQYWPDDGRASYGTFLLELLDEEVFASYTIRVVAYQTADDIKGSVRIFDFTSWPEHGVPFDPIPLLEMRQKVRQAHQNIMGPILVHCGTGMGRTGTFIAIDALIEQYFMERRVSVHSFIKKIRNDRPCMVRTLKEYVFIYEALFEEFHAGETIVGFDLKERYHEMTMRNKKTGHSFLKGQFRLLEKFTRRPRPDQCHTSLLPANYHKNRYPDVVPMEMFRPLLKTPGGIGRTDYVNATFLDGYRVKNQFILTQSPLPTTIIDFWRLVYDYDVNTIVMMETFNHEDDTCAEYWPNANMKPFEPFLVDITATYTEDNVTIRNFKIQNTHKPEEAQKFVRLFQFNGWDEPNVVPTSKTLILDLLDLVNDWQYKTNDNSRPIVVHCRDGATHSGLYCALSLICDKISADEQVDVFHTVKHMKRRRAQIVAYPEQLRFCYKTLWDYLNLRLIPEGGFTNTFEGTRTDPAINSLSLTSFYDTLYSN